jgi:hypothetical protein
MVSDEGGEVKSLFANAGMSLPLFDYSASGGLTCGFGLSCLVLSRGRYVGPQNNRQQISLEKSGVQIL